MTPLKDLTDRLDIPYHFLGKILQDLARKGLLRSLKGPSGGFTLAVPAEDITLLQIVDAVDGTAFTRTCVLGFPECGGKTPCAVHETWGKVREDISRMLEKENLLALARAMDKPEYRSARK
jgi:Rrf2 family protein